MKEKKINDTAESRKKIAQKMGGTAQERKLLCNHALHTSFGLFRILLYDILFFQHVLLWSHHCRSETLDRISMATLTHIIYGQNASL